MRFSCVVRNERRSSNKGNYLVATTNTELTITTEQRRSYAEHPAPAANAC